LCSGVCQIESILGMRYWGFFVLLALMSYQPGPKFPAKLSDYGFFDGKPQDQKPAKGVMPYELVSPLFSDYASKLRFIQMPSGQLVNYNPDSVFQFPVGTRIVKTFYYPNDERHPHEGRRLMETRVLSHEPTGWVALPYIWNEEQTEAYLEVAGGTSVVEYKDAKGKKQQVNYVVPNVNQCKGCHERDGEMTPIGPSARQMNSTMTYAHGADNQLEYWSRTNQMKSLNGNRPAFVSYLDESASLNERVKAYLDINCAHCHNPKGPAKSSGLFLGHTYYGSTAYGIMKSPVAAGRGSGGLNYDIVPGKPSESILLYRMDSHDPGIMMPELGRSKIHQEGVALIKAWIKSIH
jgi:uncharacterized repeat protein (TIGR03806 family)